MIDIAIDRPVRRVPATAHHQWNNSPPPKKMLASLSTPTPRLEQSYLYTQSTDSAHLEQDLRNQLEQANYERSMHLHKIEQLELKLRRANQGKHQHDPSSQPTPNQLKLSRRNILLRLERQIQRNQDTNDSLTQEMEQDKKRIQYEHSNLVDTLRDTKQTIQHHEKELMVHKEEHALMKKNTRQRQDSIKQEELRHETLEEKIRQLTATVTKKNQKAKGIQKDLDNEQDVQRAVVTTTKDVQNDTHDLEMSVASIGKKIKHMEEQTMPMAVTKQTTTQRTNEAHLKKIRAKQDDVQRESVLVGERTMVVKEEVRGGKGTGYPALCFVHRHLFVHRQLLFFIATPVLSPTIYCLYHPQLVPGAAPDDLAGVERIRGQHACEHPQRLARAVPNVGHGTRRMQGPHSGVESETVCRDQRGSAAKG